jgi:hypothetical protein
MIVLYTARAREIQSPIYSIRRLLLLICVGLYHLPESSTVDGLFLIFSCCAAAPFLHLSDRFWFVQKAREKKKNAKVARVKRRKEVKLYCL